MKMRLLPLFPLMSAAMIFSQASSSAVEYKTILGLNQSVTGVRGYDATNVVLTGSYQDSGATLGMWWMGSLDTGAGTVYTPVPTFSGQTVTGSLFYGPNTALFNPSLGAGNIRVVGSYMYSESSVDNHGAMYTGPLNGVGGTWTQIDVPSSSVGGATVLNTIPHSNMGDIVVGNYDLQGQPASGNAFLYNVAQNSWTIFDFGGTSNLTSAYGIWQNSANSYTIVGGSKHEGVNRAFLVNYNSVSGLFTDLTFFSDISAPGLTHFEGITAVEGGYNVVGAGNDGGTFAFIPSNGDGTFGEAHWTALDYPESNLTTGNTVYQNIAMGVYQTDGVEGVQSYTATVPEPSAFVLVGAGVLVFGLRRKFSVRGSGN